MQDSNKLLQDFRLNIYPLFPKRKDSIMNLLDAISSYGHASNSVVQLSKSDCFERQYSSITDAIGDGLPHAHFPEIQRLMYKCASVKNKTKPYRFIVDCTSNPRSHAKKLLDRHITHYPNQAPGNRPICVGHQYSVLMMIPEDKEEQKNHWLIPISAKRVRSDQKGNEVGMEQVTDSINELSLQKELCISIGDSLYGTEPCRIAAKKQDNLVHIYRMSGNRNLYSMPDPVNKHTKGRRRSFGNKMNLGRVSTYRPQDKYEELKWTNTKGKEYAVRLKSWNNMLLRGSKNYNSSKDPMTLVQVQLLNKDQQEVYKRPLWLCIFGSRRHEITAIEAYENYNSRYDIEHFFRFGKQKLLISSYQTPETEHEELWWQLCLLAYGQLYLGKESIGNNPEPWERYLTEYKNILNNEKSVITPSQAQKGFGDLLKIIGSPAKQVIARGRQSGRIKGYKQAARESVNVVFKSNKSVKSPSKAITNGSEQQGYISNPEEINTIISLVHEFLKKANITPQKFSNLLLDST